MATTKKTTTKKKTAKKAEPIPQTWKVIEIPVAQKPLYTAYRLRDESKPDEDGNRLMQGGLWQTEKEAQNLADIYNREGTF